MNNMNKNNQNQVKYLRMPSYFFIILDFILIVLMFYFSEYLVLANKDINMNYPIKVSIAIYLLAFFILSFIFKVYRRQWEMASVADAFWMCLVNLISVLIMIVGQIIILKNYYFRYSIVILLTTVLSLLGYRLLIRFINNAALKNLNKEKTRTLIIGAGEAGKQLAEQSMRLNKIDYWPVGFLDDDLKKKNKIIANVPVLGTTKDLNFIAKQYEIEKIFIAIPSANKETIRKLTNMCLDTGIHTDIVPFIEDTLTGKLQAGEIRNVNVEDILGRDKVTLALSGLKEQIFEKTILVTGAGGSIGSEISRQLIKLKPKRLILLGHGENSIYLINSDIKPLAEDTEIITIIRDVQDELGMERVFKEYNPEVIYHAAAHKHVPLMEVNPKEAIRNNVLGTYNLARLAFKYHTKTFVMISTDKAVNPTSLMGATKRVAEEIVRSFNIKEENKTRFVSVRFGNVLGSRGSVVPLFQKQIANGGPITITDLRMTRYFMSIPEAASLVLQAGSLKDDGEIYVLDMGEPVKIVDLARTLIRLSGKTEEEIKIVEVGMRPGEKLYEELITSNEKVSHKVEDKIFVANTERLDRKILLKYVEKIGKSTDEEAKRITMELAKSR